VSWKTLWFIDKQYLLFLYGVLLLNSFFFLPLRAKAHDVLGTNRTTCPSSAQPCEVSTENGIARMATRGELVEDIVAIGSMAGSMATVDQFVFSCAPTFLLNGLASGAKGMIGLGRTPIALPSQISTALGTHHKFTICLSSSDGNGIIIVSDQAPHDSVFGSEISRLVAYTPLLDYKIITCVYVLQATKKLIKKKLIMLWSQIIFGSEISRSVAYTHLLDYKIITCVYVLQATKKLIKKKLIMLWSQIIICLHSLLCLAICSSL
jgi:hypothetical protein